MSGVTSAIIQSTSPRECSRATGWRVSMKSTLAMVLEVSQRLPEGEVLTPKHFLHLGSRAAVLRSLSRLAQRGQLLRVSRGLYVAPVATRFGFLPPMTSKVIKSLAAISNELIVRNGATAANVFGLTTQVPIREIYLSDGRARALQLGRSQVQIRCAPAWQFSLGVRPAGDAVRALAWLGEPFVMDAVKKLQAQLTECEWQALVSAQNSLPTWMAKAICT